MTLVILIRYAADDEMRDKLNNFMTLISVIRREHDAWD